MRAVAERAGVSVATVSRSLAGSPGVTPDVRARVRRAADELGYHASRLPANLRAKGVRILALVVGNVRNTYFPELIDGCLEAAHSAGYPLIFGDSDEDPEREEEVLHQLAMERVAGVALASTDGWSRGLDRLQAIGIPIVAVDRRLPRLAVDTVTVESERAVYEAVGHLLDLGHRRIGLISGPPALSTLAERQAGYERALLESGVGVDPSLIVQGDLRQATARAMAPQLVQRDRPATAIVTTNDLSTVGTMQALRDVGLRVPRDVSVIGFDDFVGADLFDPPLSAISQPAVEIGRRAIEMLVRRVNAPDAPLEEVVLEPTLVLRASTAPPTGRVVSEEVSQEWITAL